MVALAEPTSSLALLPSDHVRLLHPVGRRGVATVARREGRWRETAISLPDLPLYVASLAGRVDSYVSQQSFYGWRRIAALAELGACYVDVDYHQVPCWVGMTAEAVAGAVLHTLDEARLPSPTYILATGRGLLATWLHTLVPRAALPRWMAVQRVLAAALKPIGADLKALDAARVFRLAGTENSRSHTVVRPVWASAPLSALWRWDFENLAREILPVDRAELVILRAERARRAASGQQTIRPTRTLTGATYWETVLADLQRLRQWRWFGDLPGGQRDHWLFLACNAMSWLAPPAALRREFYALAHEVTSGDWTSAECDSRMQTVFRRAVQAAKGQTIEWEGERIDPRYRFRATTIIDWLEITPTDMRKAGLRVLIDSDRQRELERERWHEQERAKQRLVQRRAAGDIDRETWRASASSRAAEVRQLREQGLTWEAIGNKLGVSANAAKMLYHRNNPK